MAGNNDSDSDFLLDEILPFPSPFPHSNKVFVTLTYAQTLNGCIGEKIKNRPLIISGEKSLEMTHQLRAIHDGILVGVNTLIQDNPRLNSRIKNEDRFLKKLKEITNGDEKYLGSHQPIPIILDSELKCPIDSKFLAVEKENEIKGVIFCHLNANQENQDKLEKVGVKVIRIPFDSENRLCLHQVLENLYTLGIKTLMVEGGSKVITSFLKNQLADRIIVTIAPFFYGGLNLFDSSLFVKTNDNSLIQAKVSLQEMVMKKLENDFVISGIPKFDIVA